MARLNEAPCANESVDALKRRFIRQNRELAKANSTQTVRIRCLEAEISRLLTENLGLRDEILQLRNDLAGTTTKRAFGGVKSQLEEQVAVLARLVAGIGLPEDENQGKDEAKVLRYPTVGWGRGMGDPMDGTDGRLPAIREDKSYPRRTMDAQDLQKISESNSESPAIGSPPVSHFHDEEPIPYEGPATVEIKKEPEESIGLPANLETRRKKRDSSTKLSIRRMSVFSSPEDEAKENKPEETAEKEKDKPAVQVQPLRAGAKRKLGTRDDDAKANDFTFSRKTSGSAENTDESSAKEDKPAREPIKAFSRRDTTRPAAVRLTERKALGEKSINTDPVVSPKKTTTTTKAKSFQEDKDALKKAVKAIDEAPRPRPRGRPSRAAVDEVSTALSNLDIASQPQVVTQVPASEPTKLDLPPKTPAASADIFSAPSTEDSSRPQAGRNGTPPPADLNGRPGRRARAQVNYAEPSLAAKMRRPTKDLVDAVGKDGRAIGGMIVRKDKDGVEIKIEEGVEGSAWRGLTSASTNRASEVRSAEAGSPLSKKSTDLESLKVMRAEPEPILPSAASQAIAALIKDSKASAAASAARRRSVVLKSSNVESDGESKERRGSSIYDFTSSSPPRSTNLSSRPSSRSSDREGEDGAKPARAGRRHSSLASLNTVSSGDERIRSASGSSRLANGIAGHKRTVSGTAVSAVPTTAEAKTDMRASRRRSMML